MATKKPKPDDEDEDEDEDEEEEEEEYRYLVCPKCGYTIEAKSKKSKKAVMCIKCGARMVKSTTRGKVKPKDMADSVAEICREIRGE